MTTMDTALEASTYEVVLSYFDSTPSAMTPASVEWGLVDGEGAVINARSAVPITGVSTTNTIELAGADLPYIPYDSAIYLVVKMVYTSTLGSGRIVYAQFEIPIEPIRGNAW